MPKYFDKKEEKQYSEIKKSGKKRGMSDKEAKGMAAATVNKQRAKKGKTKKQTRKRK